MHSALFFKHMLSAVEMYNRWSGHNFSNRGLVGLCIAKDLFQASGDVLEKGSK